MRTETRVSAEVQRSRSREEAEIRKLEAETAEIEARTRAIRTRSALLAVALLLVLVASLTGGPIAPEHGDLIGRLLP
ncbi:MAG: hypothetical protein JSS97_17945 [Actinobacteria bacterium]|nr:hypothetical protein [Actinomycetota bacterium]